MRGNKARLLSHFERFGAITSLEAFQKYGITRLSAVIFDLRDLGYKIDTILIDGENRYGEAVRYGKYVYKGKEDNNNGNESISN